MKPLYTKEEFNIAKSRQKLPLECKICKKTFYLTKHQIQDALLKHNHHKRDVCSRKCIDSFKNKKETVKCKQCDKQFKKQPFQIKKSKSGNHFCSRSCAAKYNNAHKTKGTRRSKLEVWLEKQLTKIYPNLEIHFNQKDAINSELDIYIPSLNLAFELNGIFHYEPIYGKDKLASTQNNDKRKFQACLEQGIELCIIDTSSQKYFKPKTSQKYLNIILNIINSKLAPSPGFEPGTTD